MRQAAVDGRETSGSQFVDQQVAAQNLADKGEAGIAFGHQVVSASVEFALVAQFLAVGPDRVEARYSQNAQAQRNTGVIARIHCQGPRPKVTLLNR